MFSCLNRANAGRLLLSLTALAGATAGCAQQQQQVYTPPPMTVDGAMQLRDFERSVAYYPNGDTVSGIDRFPIRSTAGLDENQYAASAFDLAASLGQTVALPFTYLVVPPFTRGVYYGDNVGPSYTAMPQMHGPRRFVNVDGLQVDAETLEVLPPRQSQVQRHGPMGPNDTEFMSSGPAPAAE
jgi:hypothetical protein